MRYVPLLPLDRGLVHREAVGVEREAVDNRVFLAREHLDGRRRLEADGHVGRTFEHAADGGVLRAWLRGGPERKGRKKSEDAARPEANLFEVFEVAPDLPADGCFATDVIAISVRHQRSPQQLLVRVTVTVLVLPAGTEDERGP